MQVKNSSNTEMTKMCSSVNDHKGHRHTVISNRASCYLAVTKLIQPTNIQLISRRNIEVFFAHLPNYGLTGVRPESVPASMTMTRAPKTRGFVQFLSSLWCKQNTSFVTQHQSITNLQIFYNIFFWSLRFSSNHLY